MNWFVRRLLTSEVWITRFTLPRGFGLTFPLYLESLIAPIHYVVYYKNASLHFILNVLKGKLSQSYLIFPFSTVKQFERRFVSNFVSFSINEVDIVASAIELLGEK